MNNILVDFKCLLCLDLGLVYTVKNKFNNPKFIDTEYLNKVQENILVYSIVKRDNENVLSLIVKEDYMDQINVLREELLNDEYDYILKMSKFTNILTLVDTYIKTNQINVTILCKSLQEEQLIKENLSEVKTIVERDNSKVDTNQYDSIFINNFKDILEFKNVYAKNIYLSRYSYNCEKDSDDNYPRKDVLDQLKGVEIYLIDVYDTNINALG